MKKSKEPILRMGPFWEILEVRRSMVGFRRIRLGVKSQKQLDKREMDRDVSRPDSVSDSDRPWDSSFEASSPRVAWPSFSQEKTHPR